MGRPPGSKNISPALARIQAVSSEMQSTSSLGYQGPPTDVGQQSALSPSPVTARPARVRKPFGSTSQKLYWPPRPGFHRHWFNDAPGRIEEAIEAGYDHVQEKGGQPVKRKVGKHSSGDAMYAFLMETPEEYFQEDMAAQQKLVDEKIAGVYEGEVLRERLGPTESKRTYMKDMGRTSR